MTWYADLSPWTYVNDDPRLIAIGWLERGKPFATVEVDRHVFEALREMRKDPWQPFVFAGPHECDLCRFEGEKGMTNLFIPAAGVIYVCPELIVHYINSHGYAPPDVFCRAVLACPPMRSMQYLRLISSCGGARLLRPSEGEAEQL